MSPPGSLTRENWLQRPWIASLCRSRFFPLAFQTLTFLLLALLLYQGFFGRQSADENFAVQGPWFLLWPLTLLPTLVLFGRLWCAVCPVGAVSAACERAGRRGAFPGSLKTPALILSLLCFVVLIRVFRSGLGLTSVPFNSALFFFAVLLVAAAFGLLFQGRPFCRYLCPITLPLNLFSRVSALELRADRSICRSCRTRECLRGSERVEGCPMDLNPASMDGICNCIYCMKCVKSCPNGSMGLYPRPPGRELLQVHRSGPVEAAAAVALVGVFPLMMAYMGIQGTLTDRPLEAASRLLAAILSSPVHGGVIHVASTTLWVLTALALFALASLAAARCLGIRFRQAFSIFGPPFVLLSVFPTLGHLAVNKIPDHLGTLMTSLLAPLGLHFYHAPNIVGADLSEILSTGEVFLVFPLAVLLTGLTLFRVARRVAPGKAAAATLPYLTLLILFLFLVGNQRLAGLGLPHL